jgi:Sulfotransferase domain
MIVWLAAYPRSGNTLLRLFLKQVFGVHTFSLYDDSFDIGANPAVADEVGHQSHGLSIEEFYQAATTTTDTYFVKTHDPPRDDAAAIYVVRDGRASIVSYFHYLRTVVGSDVSFSDVVSGSVRYQSWSEHFEAWHPRERAKTLLLTYEDLTDQAFTARTIADFLKLEQKGQFTNDFSRYQGMFPQFFRRGNNPDNIAELTGDAAELFWTMHGELMKELQYVESIPRITNTPRSLLIHQRDRAIKAERRQSEDLRRAQADCSEKEREIAYLRDEAEARLDKIKQLHADIASVHIEAEARLDLIKRLHADLERRNADCDEKDRQIALLHGECEARLETIKRLDTDLRSALARVQALEKANPG